MAAVIVVTELGSDFQKDTIVAGADLKTFSFFILFFLSVIIPVKPGRTASWRRFVEVGSRYWRIGR